MKLHQLLSAQWCLAKSMMTELRFLGLPSCAHNLRSKPERRMQDYTGENVNVETFLSVLAGDEVSA